MNLMNRFYSLLVLLLVGSASLQAQNDPFGNVDIYKYAGSMIMAIQVEDNDEVVLDAVVAAYIGDELRGKGTVGAGTRTNIAFLTIHGDYEAHPQYLLFKVYAHGKVFTYKPNPAINFEEYYEEKFALQTRRL